MKKKVIIGIVIAVVVLLILILGYGEITGKFSIFGRRYKEGLYAIYELRYEKPDVPGSLKTGIIKDDIPYASVSYSFTSKISFTVTTYRGISSERVLAGREGYTSETIHDITYQVTESTVDDEFVLIQYYTTINGNTFYISATMKDTPENRAVLSDFMNTFTIGVSVDPVDPNTGEVVIPPDPTPSEEPEPTVTTFDPEP